MPYLDTGKLGTADSTSSSRLGFIRFGTRYATYGVRMNAVIKGPIVTSYTMNAVLYPNKTTLTRTADAVLIPVSGVYLTTSVSGTVVTVGVYQGANSTGTIATQVLQRVNPTTGTRTTVATSTQKTFLAVDAAAPLGVAFYYVLSSYDAAGTFLVSTNSSTVTVSGFPDWYLVGSDGTSLTLNITDSSATILRQSEDFAPIGTAYKVVQQGEVIGRRGQLEVILTSADRSATYSDLREIAGSLSQVYLKTPFGDVYGVDVGAMNLEWVGNGNLKVTIPFIENAIA